uniref:Uncharacterized protein n=1 Tax=Cacopsylla melanoneura TaxID=428564 RepID=A0A8D8T0K0_9HEMI
MIRTLSTRRRESVTSIDLSVISKPSLDTVRRNFMPWLISNRIRKMTSNVAGYRRGLKVQGLQESRIAGLQVPVIRSGQFPDNRAALDRRSSWSQTLMAGCIVATLV